MVCHGVWQHISQEARQTAFALALRQGSHNNRFATQDARHVEAPRIQRSDSGNRFRQPIQASDVMPSGAAQIGQLIAVFL